MSTIPFRIGNRLIGVGGVGVAALAGLLAPDVPLQPFSQTDWPNPPQRKAAPIVTISSRPQDDGTPPFIPVDWKNPDLRKQQPIVFLSQILPNVTPVAQSPFIPIDYPNPAPRKQGLAVGISSRVQVDSSIAFSQDDWPLPLRAKRVAITELNNLINNTLAPIVRTPSNGLEFTVPRVAAKVSPSWIWARPISTEEPVPVGSTSNLQFLFKGPQNKGFVSPRPSYYVEPPPPAGNPWLITLGIGATPWSDIKHFILVGLDPNPTFSITTGSTPILDLPSRPVRRPTHTWLQTRQFFYTDIYPNATRSFDTPPPRRRVQNTGFINPRPFYFVQPVAAPGKPSYDVNPLLKRRNSVKWEDYYLFDPTAPPPDDKPRSSSQSFIYGKRSLRSYIGWTDYRVFDQNLPIQPVNVINTAVPRKRIAAASWLNSGLTATAVVSAPIGEQSYEIPRINKILGQTWLQQSISAQQTPFSQNDYPNPRAVKYTPNWTQNRPFYFDEPLPVINYDSPNPLVARRNSVGFISFAQIQETTPLVPYDLSLPTRAKRGTETWITNLLQSTLTPPPGETPFYQTDYPNPNSKRIGSGWIWSKPQYYVDEIPFSQVDWPVFRKHPRSFNDWIWTRITEPELPQISTVTNVPLTKRQIAQTWLVNSQENTLNPIPFASQSQKDWPNPLRARQNAVGWNYGIIQTVQSEQPFTPVLFIVPPRGIRAQDWNSTGIVVLTAVVGDKPFNQTIWPIFRSLRRIGVDFTSGKSINLPDIVGRIICLNSQAEEYDLESAQEEFDIESRQEEYDIESGGTECQ